MQGRSSQPFDYNRLQGAGSLHTQGGSAVAHVVEIRLLGAAAAWRGGVQLTFKTRKALAVLAYLAAAAGPQRRQDVAAMFWPGGDPDHARASLRTTLGYLRQSLGEAAAGSLVTTRETIGLAPSPLLTVDIKTVDRGRLLAARTASAPGLTTQLQRAVDEYRGRFLAGFTLPDVPDFEVWVRHERTRWLHAVSTVLDRLSALQKAEGDLPAAQATAERWTSLDPGAEVAWQRLIRTRLESGDSAGARQSWDACRTALAGLDRRPGAEILTLAGRIPTASTALMAPAGGNTPPAPVIISGEPARFEPGLVPLLGRERELALLQSAYEQAQGGSARLVLLEGEAGIGKTYLARKYLAWVEGQGADVLSGRAFEIGQVPRYAAVVEALRGRLEHENAPEDLVDDVWLAELATLLPELRTRYPDLPDVVRDERLQPVRLVEAVARLGLALARRGPFVLLIDDVQWADVHTRHVVGYSVRRWVEARAPCLVVLVVRSEDAGARDCLARWLGGLEREAPIVRLTLGPLGAEDVVRWVGSLTGVVEASSGAQADAAAAFGRWLADRTGGQPLYIVEMLRTLLEEGVLGMRPAAGDGWLLDVDGALEGATGRFQDVLPAGVLALIRGVLRTLDRISSELLTAAAALDEWFTAEAVCHVANVEELAGLRALEGLVRGRVLRERGDGRYAFYHGFVRASVFTEAGEARRRTYQLRAAKASGRALS